MARTMVDIDDQLLAEAARVLGTTTKKDTVNAALREVTARLRRIEALREMQEMAARGDIDLEFIDDLHNSEKAAVARAVERAAQREAAREQREAGDERPEPGAEQRDAGRGGRAAGRKRSERHAA